MIAPFAVPAHSMDGPSDKSLVLSVSVHWTHLVVNVWTDAAGKVIIGANSLEFYLTITSKFRLARGSWKKSIWNLIGAYEYCGCGLFIFITNCIMVSRFKDERTL